MSRGYPIVLGGLCVLLPCHTLLGAPAPFHVASTAWVFGVHAELVIFAIGVYSKSLSE